MKEWLSKLYATSPYGAVGLVTLVAVISLATTAVQAQLPEQPVSGQPSAEPDGLTEEELAAETSAGQIGESVDMSAFGPDFVTRPFEAPPPVSAADASGVRIIPTVEGGYRDPEGRMRVDVLEKEIAYFEIRLEDKDGRPVEGATPVISIQGSSKLINMAEVSSMQTSDESGYASFDIVAGQMGLDTVTVKFAEANSEVFVNIISLEAAGYPSLPELKDGIDWQTLMSASLGHDGEALTAEFPDSIKALAGKTVKIAGFMMPLEPALKQSRFLLTSNPPSCFFHIPGGPAGAVEVLAKSGIEASWDPIVLEGRFEPQSRSEEEVVYRLMDARLVKP